MPEINVRDCYIHLLDGYKLTVQVRPLQLTSDLMNVIATQLKLRDKECFGLYYEVSGECQCWLEPNRPVVEQVPGADLDIIILHFGVMLYQENFKHLQDGVALGLYYIQCQRLIAKNLIQCQYHTLIKLTSLVLQAQVGDFTTKQVAIEEGLRENKNLPNSFSCTEYEEYEEDILTQYRQLIGMQRKDAMLTYLEIVQELPSYGMHFYDVRDRNDVQKLVGIGLYGILQFNIENRNRPEQVYLWTGISKMSSRDNKFILEFKNQDLDLDTLLVDENVINATSQCQSIMSTVQSWNSGSHQLIRVMEQMAATQLNYFEKRKKFRVGIRLYSATSSTSSISSFGSITHSSSACTQKSDNSISSMEATQAVKLVSKEHYNALKNRKEELERVIEEKEAELRRIKLQEAKLTGIIPDDITEEERATLPKQMATSYTLQHLLNQSIRDDSTTVVDNPENDRELKRLSRAYEVQCNIVKAEYKIYKGHYTSKKIKKQRKKNYKASEKKLKELEKELEKRRDALGNTCRQSRFYSGVIDRDSYQWEVLASKSLTMPYKNNALSVVDENKVALHAPNKKAARHSSAVPLKVDPPLSKIRQKHSSNTVYNKRSNASDSFSTASPMDGNSFLSLYSRDSSSHLSSGSISSDESRCISCPATEIVVRKQIAAVKNAKQKRVSQHLDLALPEKAIKEKKKETIDTLNLDITNQVIFKPSTHYPEPVHATLPFSASIHSARDFYTKSLPLEYVAAEVNTFGKYQYTSDQISKQQYQQKLAYTQQNTNRTNRTPSPRVTAASTKYPLPYMRVNSVPYGLHSSKSPSHDRINTTSQLRSDMTHSQTLVTPTNTSYTLDRHPYTYGSTHTHSNGIMKPAVPITRIHTTPNNITTLEYAKPTHYPQNTSPKLKNKNIETRVYSKQDTHIPSTVPILYQPHSRTQNSAGNKYTNPPVCKIQITPPESQQYCITQNRYTTPYNHQSASEDRYMPNQQPQPQQQHQQQQRPSYLKTNSHGPLSFTTSLPMPPPQQQPQQPQQVSPIKYKIDYWEQHTAVNSRPSIHTSKSLEKIARQSYPPTDTDISPIVKSKSFRNTFFLDNAPPSDEGTPV